MKKKKIEKAFLPVSKDEMVERGWYYYDFLVVTADAYVDHPSFGTAIIARVLEAEGYRVGRARPAGLRHSADAFRAMGRPRYGVIDQLAATSTRWSRTTRRPSAAARRTSTPPATAPGLRPDRADHRLRQPLPRGLRRYPHRRRRAGGKSCAALRTTTTGTTRSPRDHFSARSEADLLVYGMGEYADARDCAPALQG